jgi:hypothetical protein
MCGATPSDKLIQTLQRLCIRTTSALELPNISVCLRSFSLTPAEKTMYLITDSIGKFGKEASPLLACAGLNFMETNFTIGTTDVNAFTLPRSIRSRMTPTLICARSNISSTQLHEIPAVGDNFSQWKHFLDPSAPERMTKFTELSSIMLAYRSERTVVFISHSDVADHIRSIANSVKLRYFKIPIECFGTDERVWQIQRRLC